MRVAAATVAMLVLALGGAAPAGAAEKFYAYDLTTSSDFTEVYLAPAGTEQWGKNQALNDSDKALNVTERLLLTGIGHKVYDVKLVDQKGRTCIKRGVDLTQDKTFDIREADLAGCQ